MDEFEGSGRKRSRRARSGEVMLEGCAPLPRQRKLDSQLFALMVEDR